MQKKIRKRAVVLFDSIDLEILEELEDKNQTFSPEELRKKLKISSKPFKEHYTRLAALKLLPMIKEEQSESNQKKVLLLSGAAVFPIITPKKRQDWRVILKKLKDAREYRQDKQAGKINLDFRKNADIERLKQ